MDLYILYNWQGDGKPFWKFVVSEATGCANDDYFEEVYGVMLENFKTYIGLINVLP